MHIDHSKLVELLVETSGIEKEKAESQLSDLVDEIKEAIGEGDAYELSGLGVFSGIGNNVIFIPSDELATEINYKYVGMEPIEMEASPEQEEPQKDVPQPDQDTGDDDEEDPFAGLLGDEEPPGEKKPSFELDMTDDEGEEESIDEKEAADIEDFADSDDNEAPFDLADEELDEETEEVPEKPGPDKWGIDTYKDEGAESMFSGFLGKEEDKTEEHANDEESQAIPDEDEPEDFGSLAAELEKQFSGEEDDESAKEDATLNAAFRDDESPSESSKTVSEGDGPEEPGEEEDFDDPFEALARDDANEEDEDDITADFSAEQKENEEEEEEEEVVPVITNLASESSKKKKGEAEKEEGAKPMGKKQKVKKEPGSQPVMLWIIIIILLLGGGTYGLGYYGIVTIPGVTPEPSIASSTPPTTSPANQQPPAQQEAPPQQEAPEEQTSQPEATGPETEPESNATQEQESQPQVSQNEEVPANQPTYGMNGVPVPAANDGYTIVIYSLTRESNAVAKRNELANQGYRVLIATIPSQQYGTLWRVSLGQFQTMRDAALAAETLGQPFSENYFITSIQ